jgi:hypothetical protein
MATASFPYFSWMKQTVRMVALHVALYALGTQHAAIEREVFPGFKSDYLVLANFKLNPTLLSTKAAVRLNQLFGRMNRLILPAAGGHVIQSRAKLRFQGLFG